AIFSFSCLFFSPLCSSLFLFHHPAATSIYTLSLHDALPICSMHDFRAFGRSCRPIRLLDNIHSAPYTFQRILAALFLRGMNPMRDRKSTRLNSSHVSISYAVFCLKKKTHEEHMR